MASPTPLRLDDVERSQILDFALRLRAVRWQALLLLVVVVAVGVQAFGPLIVPPAVVLAAGFAVLGHVISRVRRVEWPLIAVLVFSQAAIVVMLTVAERWSLDALGLLVLPAAAACILFPPRLMVVALPWCVAVMTATAFAIDTSRVLEMPPVLLLPLGVMLSVALPAAMIRRLELASRDTAMVDTLTGALNRAALESRIAQLDAQAHTMPLRVGVVMADLDHFKQINDELGHDAGDAVLRDVVVRMRSVLGPLTPVYRVGGEEFAVLLAGADEHGVHVVAERLRAAVGGRPVAGRMTTMSFGVAAATLDEHPVTRTIEVADEALYRAKRAGRDRVAVGHLRPMQVVADSPSTVSGSTASSSAPDRAAVDAAEAHDGRDASEPFAPSTLREAPRPLGALVHDQGNWMVRNEFERDHLREAARALSRTHHGALGFVFVALLSSIPWLGWHLIVPAIPALVLYHAAERRVMRMRRPEYLLAGAWLLVQLSIFAGALIADPAEPYMLILFTPLMIGMTAVFPSRGVLVLSLVTVLMCTVAGAIARPDLVASSPGLIGPLLLIVTGIALMSSVTGRSAVEFRTRAVVDPLTGLLTRAALRSRLDEVAHEAFATTAAVSVIAFDIDHFKPLNDEHGHAAGDEALRAVGAATRSRLQALEWAFRLGGDEFLVVVPAGAAAAARLAEELRSAVADTRVAGVALTGSFGVATSEPGVPFDFAAVSRRADTALYEAKRAGRNRVAVAASTAASAGLAPVATVLRDIA